MEETITAAAGFLVAVLWLDLMFDVQLLPHRRSQEVPEIVLASISGYCRRVTITASPMGRLVGLTMMILLLALMTQAASGDAPAWTSVVSPSAVLPAVGLVVLGVFGRARRLGACTDSLAMQSRLARHILRDHLICLAAMVVVLVVQIVGA